MRATSGTAREWRRCAAAAVLASHGRSLRRTARRHSLCADDAEDALQRAAEILLTKAPLAEIDSLVAWTQTVTRREALALRRRRQRLLGTSGQVADEAMVGTSLGSDWCVPDPCQQLERRERVAAWAAALAALKPQERRAIGLLAAGCSYAEIQAITGWTYTKVNRCLSEGRAALRSRLPGT